MEVASKSTAWTFKGGSNLVANSSIIAWYESLRKVGTLSFASWTEIEKIYELLQL